MTTAAPAPCDAGRSTTTEQARPTTGGRDAEAARRRLATILDQAGTLDLADRVGWAVLAVVAQDVLDELISDGRVPEHLAVRRGEPAVVVRRTLAAALRHAHRGTGRLA